MLFDLPFLEIYPVPLKEGYGSLSFRPLELTLLYHFFEKDDSFGHVRLLKLSFNLTTQLGFQPLELICLAPKIVFLF